MHRTYAVSWQNAEAVPYSGKLDLGDKRLTLEGSHNGSGVVGIVVPYGELECVRAGRGSERLGGRPTLVVEQRGRASLRIASVAAPGIISEVAEELAKRRLGPVESPRRVAVVLPLREGTQETVHLLLEGGPPFDPADVGLERHEVFVSEREAIFIFDGASASALDRLVGDAGVWASAAAWRDCLAGPPRVATESYAWSAGNEERDELFFDATPGPGDSEGGDIYSP